MGTVELWIASIIVAYCLAIIQIYGCYYFKSMQSLLIIQKRYPTLVLIEAYAVLIYLIIAIPFLSNDLYNATTFGMNSSNYIFVGLIFRLSVPITSNFINIIEVSRLWLVSYDLHHLHSSLNETWKSQIDHSFAETDWYIKNKNKYGNTKYIITRAMIYYSFVTLIVVSCYCIYYFKLSKNNIGAAVGLIYFFVNTIFTFYIYYKCRKYTELNDNMLFHYEFKATIIAWSIGILLWFIAYVPFIIDIEGLYIAARTLAIIMTLWTQTAASFLSTLWIPMKIASIEMWNDYDYSLSTGMINMKGINENNGSVESKLHAVLKNEKQYENFIQWMYREFSSESMLCFTELVQFKEYLVGMIKNINSHSDNSKSDTDYKYMNLLYDSIPKSSILYSKNDKNTIHIEDIAAIRMMAHAFYEKYIMYEAKLEVNIAANLRRKYIVLDGNNWNLDIYELANLYDAVINEMFLFMRNSYVRYEKIYTD